MPEEPWKTQRFLTIDFITKQRLPAPVIWLKPESAASSPEDAVKDSLNTDLEEWRDPADERNLGLRLVDGFIELKIRAADDIWFKLFAPQVDARAAYGGLNHPVSSVIFRIDDPSTIDHWVERWPSAFKDKSGRWVDTKFVHSLQPTPRSKAVWRNSSPLPGSRFGGDPIVWRPRGKPAAEDIDAGIDDLEARPIAATSMESICRAIAFATLGYWIRVYLDGLEQWDESLTRVIGGWMARLQLEGRDINARGKSLEHICWSPIDTKDTISDLLRFLATLGATKDLGVAYLHAEGELERNPQARVPGWTSIETLFGPQAKIGLRRAFRAGIDIDAIERMSDQYVYDRTTHVYLDREDLLKGLGYEHKHDELVERHKPERIVIGKKAYNPFDLYSGSELRTDVHHREFRPGHEPASILRISPVYGILKGEERQPDEFRTLNTFPGFTIKPIAVVDPAVMREAVTMLDRMLGYLTQENDNQMWWLKKNTAWTVQHPEIKPQVCPVIIGGQGTGKSIYGGNFMVALFGRMAGLASADLLSDNKFTIEPFLNKLIVFIDEVRLETVGAINMIKKLIRSDIASGQRKFKNQQDHYIPTRLLIATNQPDIGLKPEDAVDRAFFFILAWTAQNKRMLDNEFLEWTLTLKPFYDQLVHNLESVVFKQHLMRYFMEIEVTRAELEDLTHSSRNDENVVRATMSKTREIARAIVADARVLQGSDITAWFNHLQLRDAIKRWDDGRIKVEASQVMMEYERAGVIERMRGDHHRFKYGYGRLLQKLSEAHNLELLPLWPIEPVGVDWANNTVSSPSQDVPWRGNKQQKPRRREPEDPDAMQPF